MATKEQLTKALMDADAAGDTEAAQMFADELKRMAVPGVKAEPVDNMMNDVGNKLLKAPDVASDEARVARRSQEYDNGPEWAKPLVAASDIGTSMADSMSFGFGDKAAAYLKSLTSDKPYDEALSENRDRTQAARDRAGWAGTVGDVTGALATGKTIADAGITASRVIPQGTGLLQRLLSAAAIGGAEGAGYGALDAKGHDTDVTSGALMGAGLGAGLNTLSEGALSALGGLVTRLRGTNAVPSMDELAARREAAYSRMENSGAQYTPQSMIDMANQARDDVVNVPGGARPTNHGATLDKLDELTGLVPRNRQGNPARNARPVGMYDLDEIRKSVRRDLTDGPNAHFAPDIIRNIDEAMADVDPSRVTTVNGTPQEALDSLLQGRNLAQREFKVDELSTAVRKADRRVASSATGDTTGNQMRQNLRSILDSESKASQFSPEELARLEDIVSGTYWGNKARRVASAANSEWGAYTGSGLGGFIGNAMMPGPLGIGAGVVAGRLGSKAVGDIAEGIAERSTRRGVDELIGDISRGRRRIPSRSAASSPDARDELTRMLLLMQLQDENGAKD